jgi:hypothetical protein
MIENGAPLDISGASTHQILVYKPDASVLTYTGAFVTDGTDGLITYTVPGGSVDDVGYWRALTYLVIGGNPIYSDEYSFRVFSSAQVEKTTTLAEASLMLAETIGRVYYGTATGGSVKTLIDNLMNKPSEYLTGGVLWFLSGNNTGKFVIIRTWTVGRKEFAFDTQSLACSAGDRYAVSTMDFPQDVLIRSINQVLRGWTGRVEQQDTSLVSVSNQGSYNLPIGVHGITRVEFSADTNSSLFVRHYNWQEQGGALYFDRGQEIAADGRTLRLTYPDRFFDLANSSDPIDGRVDLDWLRWQAAVIALRWRMDGTRDDDTYIKSRLNEAIANAQREEGIRGHPYPAADPHLAGW